MSNTQIPSSLNENFVVVSGSKSILYPTAQHPTENDALRPDNDIEQFWLSFKQSMANFYSLKIIPSRDIQSWSDTLNQLQSSQRYSRIEKLIYNYITLYGLDLLRSGSRYHLGILITNIRRWDKIAARHKILQSSHENNIVTILLEVAASFIRSGTEFDGLFEDLELYLIHDDYTRLINYAIKHHKSIMLDRLIKFNYLAVNESITELTGVDFSDILATGISGKKLLEKINHTK